MTKTTDKLTVTLPCELVKDIKREAINQDTSASELVRQAMTKFLLTCHGDSNP